MAKKKTEERKATPDLLNAFQGARVDKAPQGQDNLANVADWAMKSMTDEQRGQFVMMYTLASSGVTPDDYAQFYHIFQATGALAEDFMSGNDDDDFPLPMGRGLGRGRFDVKEYEPLEDASQRSLVLKIQMKDVTKPPMWREVEIPADFDFLQLHEVIQEVTGLEDSHLWQFNVKAYDDSLVIGLKMDRENPFLPGVEFVTHEAEKTVVSRFLHQKGDKLEYVYDFGDDWIFIVEVKDVIDKKNQHPVCRKYKSELNAIEDFGGVWAYEEARSDLEEWGQLSKKERKERVEQYGFESEQDYLEFLNEHRMNLDDVNDALRNL